MISDIAYVDMRLNGLSLKILQMNPDVLRSLGILKKTVLEQMVATRDIIMILDPDYGCGHTRTYFSTPWKRETEFVVYCLNNTFNPNMVFRKYLPDLYDDMIQYVKDYL